ncbi:MAG: hypothetical protein K2L07_10900 [Lachnospiraceae bacterium]|nr:hypothetical protein [Lachnospiraceae bacterium]
MALETYRILFLVFLVFTIILFFLSIILFFTLDIRNIFSIKTGRAVRKSVRELNEINRNEDNFRRKKYKGRSMQLDKESAEDFRNNIKKTDDDDICKRVSDNAGMVTVPLELNETVVLENFAETAVVSNMSAEVQADSARKLKMPEEKGLPKKEEIFRIIDKKVVMFSQEIIRKEN